MNQEQPIRQTPINDHNNRGSALKIVIWIVVILLLITGGYFIYSWFYSQKTQMSGNFSQEDIDLCNTIRKAANKNGESYNQQQCLSDLQISKNSSANKAKDVRIKGNLSQLRTVAENNYSKSNTYVGFDVSADANKINIDVKSQGSEVNYQNITKESYLFYAKLITENGYFCVDSKGKANTVANITPDLNTCPIN